MRSFSSAMDWRWRWSWRWSWRWLAVLLIVCFVATPVAAQEAAADAATAPDENACVAWCNEPTANIGLVMFDLLVLRSLQAAQTAVGIGAFGVVAPFTFPFGRWRDAWNVFVKHPFEQTFIRKLGDL